MRKVSNEKTGRIFGIVIRAAAGAMAALVAGTALAAVPYNVLADEVIMEWREENGVKYWYENGVRQGVKYREDGSIDASYRGKEIYDPSSNAWYWLDCVQNGAVAKDKDVYQESQADDAGNIGKWVRYDADGHMIKGWSEKDGNKYYFDPVYGTMAKGLVRIENDTYYFDMDMGVLNRNVSIEIDGKKYTCDADGKVNENNDVKDESYLQCKVTYYESDGEPSWEGEYDRSGEMIASTYFRSSGNHIRYKFNKDDNSVECTENGEYWKYKTSLMSLEEFEVYMDCAMQMGGESPEYWLCDYKDNSNGVLHESYYDEYGNFVKSVNYNADGTVADVYEENQEYEYYENGTIKRLTIYSSGGDVEYVREFNENGKLKKEYSYYGGEPEWIDEYSYDVSGHCISVRTMRLVDGFVSIETKVIFSESGKFCGMSSIRHYDGVYFEMVYAYDDNMNLIKQKFNYYDDIDMCLMTDVSEGYEYVYDEYGNQINIKEIKDGQEVNYARKYEYDYADNGKISQVKEYRIGDDGTAVLFGTQKNEFDAHGNCILSTCINNKTGKSYIAMKAEYVYE